MHHLLSEGVLRLNLAIAYYCFIQYAIIGGRKFLEAPKTTFLETSSKHLGSKSLAWVVDEVNCLWDHPFKTSANFHDF